MVCYECDEKMSITSTGVSHHLTEDDEIDHDADADHVAYTIEEEEL